MKFISFVTLAGLLAAAIANCHASDRADAVSLKFQGALLDDNCMAEHGAASTVELKDCPLSSLGSIIDVQRVSASGRAEESGQVNAKLIADTGPVGRHFDRVYALTDEAGQSLVRGNYVITMTTP